MLDSTEHEISIAHEGIMLKKKSCFKLLDAVFILLINVKMPTIVGILTFMGSINFLLSLVELESFINNLDARCSNNVNKP